MKTIRVNLPDRDYSLHIGQALLEKLPQYMQKLNLDQQIYIITDDNVNSIYGDAIQSVFTRAGIPATLFSVPPGESSKSLSTANDLYTKLLEHRATRKSTIVAFGGGVVGDLAGFVAATFLRGIDFVQVPTTILSQVDSSVGGKVGINHALGKNLIGAFYQPKLVLMDIDVLKTLPNREINAGLAEVVKYGLIWDKSFVKYLEEHLSALMDLSDINALEHMLATCCQIKAKVVEEDEKENGLRAILNFGHTAGHALEAVTGYQYFLHGEAIIHGMRAALKLSVLDNLLPQEMAERGEKLVNALRPAAIPGTITVDDIFKAMQGDKKRTKAGQLWVLLESIGKYKLTRSLNEESVTEAVQYMLATGAEHA